MRGRFFISVLVLSTILFAFLKIRINYLSILVILFFSFFTYNIGFKERFLYKTEGLTNERNYYKNYLGLNLNPYNSYFYHPWGVNGQILNKDISSNIVIGVNGQRGFWIEQKELIDLVGLTDAFIARTPIIDNSRIGHFVHEIPEEYFKILNGEKVENWNNKELQKLHENLNIVIKGELFTKERLNAMIYIWKNYGI